MMVKKISGRYLRPHVQDSGVSLIVLIITVVVLLIIAGVTIYSIAGEGGLMNQAQSEQHLQKILTFKQEVQMDIAEITNAIGAVNISPTDSRLVDRLQYRGYTATPNGDGTLSLIKGDMEGQINEDLTVSVVGYDI